MSSPGGCVPRHHPDPEAEGGTGGETYVSFPAGGFGGDKPGPYAFDGNVCVDKRLDEDEREAAQIAKYMSVMYKSMKTTAPDAFAKALELFKTTKKLLPDAAAYKNILELRVKCIEDVIADRKDDFMRDFPSVYEATAPLENPTGLPTLDAASLESCWIDLRAKIAAGYGEKIMQPYRVAIKGATIVFNAMMEALKEVEA